MVLISEIVTCGFSVKSRTFSSGPTTRVSNKLKSGGIVLCFVKPVKL
jgi:hypothetical protein